MFFWILSLLILTILISVVIYKAVQYSHSGEQKIDSELAKLLIESGHINKIIDVRTDLEWQIGHHMKAIHIPTSKINEKSLQKSGIKKTDNILVYCNTGQRARIAAEKIRKLGYTNTFYIVGSYSSI